MISRRGVTAFLFAAFCSLPAAAKLQFDVNRVEGGKRVPFTASQVVKPVWLKREENVHVLYVVIGLKSPEFASYDKVRTGSRSTQTLLKNGQLILRLDGASEKVLLTGKGGKLLLEVVARPDPELVLDENCRGSQLVLQPLQKPLPFYAGTSCQRVKGVMEFSLTFPREAEFTSSTLFETKGKGERYRLYELGKIQVASGTLGKFTVEYKGKPYEFALESLLAAPSKEEKPPPREIIGVSAGYAMLKLTGDDIDASDGKPLVRVKVPHYPIKGALGVTAGVDFAIPMGSSDSSLSYRQFELFADYELAFGRSRLRPKLGYVVFSQENTSSGIGLDANQVGYGAVYELGFGERSAFQLDLMLTGAATSWSIEAAYIRRKVESFGWSIGGRLQTYRATGDLEIERQFGQTLFFAMLSF